VVSSQRFDEGVKGWIELINGAINKELDDGESYRALFDRIHIAMELFLPAAEKLPTDQTKWVHKSQDFMPRTSSIHSILEFIIQGLYMEASHLWAAANHSARCAIEHTELLIWHIGYPTMSNKTIGGPDHPRFKTIRENILEMPRFRDLRKKTPLTNASGHGISLFAKSEEIYNNLSHYVHTSNIQIDQRGARPHITSDLVKNSEAEEFTKENIKGAFDVCIIFLGIACWEIFGVEEKNSFERLTSPDIRKFIEE